MTWIQIGIALVFFSLSIYRLKNKNNWQRIEDYDSLRFHYRPWATDIFLMFIHMVFQYYLAENLPVFGLKELILSLGLFLAAPVWAMVSFLNEDADKLFLRQHLKK